MPPRPPLPQLGNQVFLADGGIETTLIFHDGIELPDFAAFDLYRTAEGTAALRRYFDSYADLARRHRAGLIVESATWRASADWGARLGYSPADLDRVNRLAIAQLEEVRADLARDGLPLVISGSIGPRGDGYNPTAMMIADEADAYHRAQVATFAATAVDMVSALTMNYTAEAVGVTRAARAEGIPIVIAFTVETDGRLPTGDTLEEAVLAVETATDGYPAYYMVNCAHPTHFDAVLDPTAAWTSRIRGVRANASRRSHAELNDAPDLDPGNPEELGQEYAALRRRLPWLTVLGGCCGTDTRHIDAIARECLSGER
jgi:S-methylmethionine-dependent homocysteine/selenocysteine methylase